MRALILALIPALLVACGDDTVALTSTDGSSTLGPGTSTDGDPTSPTSTAPGTTVTTSTTSPGTSVGSDTATDSGTTTSVTTDATSVSGTTTDATTLEPSTGEPGTSTTDTTAGTTGGALGCGMDGPEIDANLVHIGEDPGCGTLEFNGTNNSDSSGPVYALDACPCGANCLKPDPWTLTLDVPMAWLPGKIPVCPRIVVERQKSKQGCELVGIAIWDSQEPADALAHYYAGSMLGPLGAAMPGLKVEQIEAETCDCDNCCNTPTRLDLKFSIAQKSGTVAEGEQLSLSNGEGDSNPYEVKNFQSHLSGICDDSPHIDWVMRKLPPAP